MQLQAPHQRTPYHNTVRLSLQNGKKQRPYQRTYQSFARCAHGACNTLPCSQIGCARHVVERVVGCAEGGW